MSFIDPLTGIEYKYKSNMYKIYGISNSYYLEREAQGMTPEEIVLDYTSNTKNNRIFIDPLTGVEYKCKGNMYKKYGISTKYYLNREAQGMTPEEIVLEYTNTSNTKKKKIFIDPLTGKYECKSILYKKYSIPYSYYSTREAQGMTPEEIVLDYTKNTKKKIRTMHIDPLTGKYECKSNLYKKYKIPHSYYSTREAQGMTPEEIVLDYTNKNKKVFIDPLTGVEYKYKYNLYKNYGISSNYFTKREAQGMTPEEIVLEYINIDNNMYIDPVTRERLTIFKLIKKYNIQYYTFHQRIKRYSLIQSLGISLMIRSYWNNINQTKYNITVAKRIQKGKNVFECYIDNGDGTSTFKIMTCDMIDQYCLEQYKKLHNIA